MADYSNSFNGSGKDAANSTILGADFDTQFNAIATMSGDKADKAVPAATGNLATLGATGNLVDSGESVSTIESFAKRGAIHLVADAGDISFDGANSITSTTTDLSVFLDGDVITITGTTLNNTSYTVSGNATSTTITTTTNTVTESGQTPTFTTEGVVQVLDEDTLASDSATAVPSQQSTKAYVDTQVTAVPNWSHVGSDNSTADGTWEVTGISASATQVRILVVKGSASDSTPGSPRLELGSSTYSGTGAVGSTQMPNSWADNIDAWVSGVAYLVTDWDSAAADDLYAEILLSKVDTTTDTWLVSILSRATGTDGDTNTTLRIYSGLGSIDTAADLDRVKITLPAATWDGGTMYVWEYA